MYNLYLLSLPSIYKALRLDTIWIELMMVIIVKYVVG